MNLLNNYFVNIIEISSINQGTKNKLNIQRENSWNHYHSKRGFVKNLPDGAFCKHPKLLCTVMCARDKRSRSVCLRDPPDILFLKLNQLFNFTFHSMSQECYLKETIRRQRGFIYRCRYFHTFVNSNTGCKLNFILCNVKRYLYRYYCYFNLAIV